MSKFIGSLLVEPLPDGRFWKVCRQYGYQSDVLDATVKIPIGFITDGASVPRIFWNILSPTGPYFRAAIIHDYLYRWRKFTRHQNDDALLEGMWVLKCKFREYCVIYVMVRLFGWYSWKKDAKNPISEKDLLINRNMIIGNSPAKYKFWRHS